MTLASPARASTDVLCDDTAVVLDADYYGFQQQLSVAEQKSVAVAPGFIATDMTRATADRLGVSFEEFLSAAVSDIPVRRAGQPEDVAAAISFFCSEGAGFVSGQVLYVAGGPKT